MARVVSLLSFLLRLLVILLLMKLLLLVVWSCVLLFSDSQSLIFRLSTWSCGITVS